MILRKYGENRDFGLKKCGIEKKYGDLDFCSSEILTVTHPPSLALTEVHLSVHFSCMPIIRFRHQHFTDDILIKQIHLVVLAIYVVDDRFR